MQKKINQMEFKSKLSNKRIGGKKSEKQENEIRNITNFYDARDKVIKFYKDYSSKIFDAGYDATHQKGLKILTPEQIPRRLQIALAQIKAVNTSENLLNEF